MSRSVPSFLVAQDAIISMAITGTDALLADQGHTYNEAGLTYNQAGVQYGGIYKTNQDDIPMELGARFIDPINITITDLYTHPAIPPGPNNQKVVGPGWFMFISQ